MVKNTSLPNYIRTKVESNSYQKNVKRYISVQYKCSELNCCKDTPPPPQYLQIALNTSHILAT